MVDPEKPNGAVLVDLLPKGIGQVLGMDALRASPYAGLLMFAIWWLNSSWQADKTAAAVTQAAQITTNAEAVKKQAELTVVAVDKVAVQQTIQLKDLATSYTGQLEMQAKDHAQQLTTMERLLTHRADVNETRLKAVAAKVEEIAPQEGGSR